MTDSAGARSWITNRTFLSLWSIGALNSTGRWLDMLVIAIFVFDQTGSPLWVSGMLMLRLLPLSLFGLFGGVLASRLDRWKVMRGAAVIACLSSAVIIVLAHNEQLAVWHLGLLSFVSGVIWSTDFPARRTLMGDMAGTARVGQAMSLDILAGAATRMLGPIAGGVLYQDVGLIGAFCVSGLLYLLSLLTLTQRSPNVTVEAPNQESIVAVIVQGFRALRSSSTLPGILAVTLVFNLWGFPFVSLVPVFAKEILVLGDAQTGLFTSMEGAGALLGAIVLSLYAQNRHSRYLYFYAVVAYCVFVLLFSVSAVMWLSAMFLFFVGLVSAAFGSMQSALVLMNAPPGYQRQMMGVLSVCIGIAPVGFLHIGLLADWLGVALACTITAAEGLLAMLLVVWRWPQLLSLQPSDLQPSNL